MDSAWSQQASQLLNNDVISAEQFFQLATTDEESGPVQLRMLLGYAQRLPRPQQDPVWHELAAKHLPELVTKFRSDDSGPLTPTARVINVISYTPYFIRFLSTPPARSPSLASLYTHRVSQHSQSLSASSNPDDVAETCQFLATLLLVQGTDDIQKQDKDSLLPVLRQWVKRPAFRGRLASDASERVVWLLTGDRSMAQPLSMVRNHLIAPLEKCSAQGCSKTRANGDLMKCSRCKSALFCTKDHQKLAWGAHKRICFEPVF
ncbi:hypothetical protein BDY19DRAFT_935212 [Irpex rosettiformis]|uniref:Uncharacterized protein n=1 Tax=Irpex rosettiformis TaxID=378272 RepID=A0ACB8UAR0_9APHY|nr:hypothetical protein BDY19DRAFT_935212 [Irpex rosettiformis]